MLTRPVLCRVLLVLAAGCTGLSGYAADRVSLRNGFSYDCAREQAVDTLHTRLFLASTAETGYVDVPTAEIAAIDPLPPAATPPAAASKRPSSSPAPHDAPRLDTRALLASAGSAHNIDVELLASLVAAESGGHARALSRAGAQGLMQLMPSTAHALGVADSLAPDQNVNGGTTYLDWLLTRYRNNLALALAAYNAGPAAVDRFHGIPPFHETRAYVLRVMTEFKRRKEALARQNAAPSLRAAR